MSQIHNNSNDNRVKKACACVRKRTRENLGDVLIEVMNAHSSERSLKGLTLEIAIWKRKQEVSGRTVCGLFSVGTYFMLNYCNEHTVFTAHKGLPIQTAMLHFPVVWRKATKLY